jgi:WD40 repeat protein
MDRITSLSRAGESSAVWEGLLKRFEQAWRGGPPPAIDDYLPAADLVNLALLVELVHIDLEFRLKAGEAARAEDYLARYPALAADPDAVLDLLAAEHALRRRAEPDLDPAEYDRRFPAYARALRQRLAGASVSGLSTGVQAAPVGVAPALSGTAAPDAAEARPVGETAAAPRPRRNVAALAAPLVALVAVGLALWQWRQAEGQRREAEEAVRRMEGEQREAGAERYALAIPLAARLCEDGETTRAGSVLRLCPPGLRGWEWHYLDRQCHATRVTARVRPGVVTRVAFCPDGRHVAAAGSDEVVLLDAETGAAVARFEGHTTPVLALAFAPDGRRLAASATDGRGKVWDAETAQVVLSFGGADGPVGGLAFSGDGQTLATGGPDGRVRFWDAATGQPVGVCEGHTQRVNGLAFRPDRRLLASAGQDGSVKLWDVKAAREVCSLSGHAGAVLAVAFSPDGIHLASAGEDRTVRVWSAESRSAVHTLRGHTHWATALDFSPDRFCLASASLDGTVRVWAVRTGTQRAAFHGHAGQVTGVSFSPDGSRLASVASDGEVRLWDVSVDHGPFSLPPGVEYGGLARRFKDRPRAWYAKDRTVRLWNDVAGPWEWHTLSVEAGEVIDLAAGPRGQWAATATRNGMLLTGSLIGFGSSRVTHQSRFGEHPGVASIDVSADGNTLVSARDGEVRLWDVATSREVRTLHPQERGVKRVRLSPDGLLLAAATQSGAVHLWDAADGRTVRTLQGHSGPATDVAFSPDGDRLASAGSDRTVRVWDTATGQELLVLRGHDGAVLAVLFDGGRLYSLGADGTVRVWDGTPREEAPDR